MNKNTFFHIMKNIINNFEQFQKSIQNKDYENVIPYLIDNKKEDYNLKLSTKSRHEKNII